MLTRRSLIRASAATGAAAALTTGTGGLVLAAGTATVPWAALADALTGRLVLPGDAGYDTARQLQLAQFDAVHPQGVAYCATEADVTTAVRFAQDNGLATAVRSGGHSAAGYSTTPGLVIDVSRLSAVRVDGATVHLGPGTQGIDALNALAPYGVQIAGGTCPTVAMGGWLQGGGFGYTSRKYGMGSDRLVSARVVLADGRIVRTSATEHPDLFWALRGAGGGNLGIVTAYEVTPVPIPSLTLFNLNFRYTDAHSLILAWQEWMASAPRELACELMFLHSTDAPAGTEPTVVLTGAYHGPKSDADRLLDRLTTAVGHPGTSRAVDELPYTQAMMRVYGCGDLTVAECHRVGFTPEAQLPRESHTTQRNLYFSQPWTPAAVRSALDALTADPRPGQFRFLGLFPYGGRINEISPTATAFVHRDAVFNAGFSVTLPTADPAAEAREAARVWVDTAHTTMDAYSNHESYQNYMDPALTNWRQAYYGRNLRRLRAVKCAYDPDRFFRFAQSVD
ncbi:FAD-binding oxidoreductase [Streptomyces sp. V17-9]|uniref:FAD-binding oxidoreductase n=1 Tax=Streptomyces sp. V17-9 TaxID=2831149 RepID=UPI001BB036C4|nr:FAD-binding oxidoreductase [Streptomyces sp. V17-9]QUW93924.1 putative FAD-linked oxidoreductase YvdP [Streptomyces sp. V17-9]